MSEMTMRVVDAAGFVRWVYAERAVTGWWWAEFIGPVAPGETPREAVEALASLLGWGPVTIEEDTGAAPCPDVTPLEVPR